MPTIQNLNPKCLLVILDGFGLSKTDFKNAIKHAPSPHIDELFAHYPWTEIEPGGELVGLPKGVAGNSEVGHMNLGAGRPVRQDLVRINEAISNNNFKDLPELKKLIKYAKSHSNRIHLMGLLSDGGVHSHIDHLKEIVAILAPEGITLFLHAFMDGRDTPKNAGASYLKTLVSMPDLTFASMQGRSIGMDRDRRWNKIEECVSTFMGDGAITKLSPLDYLNNEYNEGRFDEFISPVLFHSDYKMEASDAVFFFNFRPDRAIQITRALADKNFREFEIKTRPGYFLCMTPYVQDFVDLPILFDKEKIRGTLSYYLSTLNKKQFKIAETEKYAHITFFFNGGEKAPFPLEDQVLVPSPKEVATYDQKPEMSAYLVLDKLVMALEKNEHDFYLVNFANSDMVGHTGNYEAAVKAISTLDQCLLKLKNVCKERHVTMVVTADHGNADQMIYENGDIHTSHTDALVPFLICDERLYDQKCELREGTFALGDVAPTLLTIMGLKIPDEFQGKSIFK